MGFEETVGKWLFDSPGDPEKLTMFLIRVVPIKFESVAAGTESVLSQAVNKFLYFGRRVLLIIVDSVDDDLVDDMFLRCSVCVALHDIVGSRNDSEITA